MSVPSEPVPVPDINHRIAAGRQMYPAWANEIGGDERLDCYLTLREAGE